MQSYDTYQIPKTAGHALLLEARFYTDIAEQLANGAISVLQEVGMTFDRLDVPGALELPAALKWAIETGKYDCFVVLGCVIRGSTYHFELVANESVRGLQLLALSHDAAVGNGVLTVDTMPQAVERADPKQMNKGGGAAIAAVRMLNIKRDCGVQ